MKIYYAWWGNENIIYTQPNDRTGSMTRHGDMFAFKTIEERDEFCKNRWSNLFEAHPVATTREEAKRKYFGGITKTQFDEYMLYVNDQVA